MITQTSSGSYPISGIVLFFSHFVPVAFSPTEKYKPANKGTLEEKMLTCCENLVLHRAIQLLNGVVKKVPAVRK